MNRVTIISSTVPKILAKRFRLSGSKILKEAVASVTEGLVTTVEVNGLGDLAKALLRVVQSRNMCIVPSGFIDSPAGDRFHLVAEYQLAKMLNKPTGDPGLAGIHLLNGKRVASRLKRSMVPSAYLLLDADNPPGMPPEWAAMTIGERLELWEPLVPGISKCERVELRGSSSRVTNGTPGMHTHAWIRVSNPEKIPALKAHVAVAMVNEGLSFRYEKHSRNDSSVVTGIEARSVFDLAVWDIGRIVFCAKPELDASMVQAGYSVADPDIRIINPDGGDLDIGWAEVPAKEALTRYEKKTGVSLHFSGTGTGISCVSVGQLTLDTEIEVKGAAKPLRDWAKGMKPGAKLRCESPFRESHSEAAFIGIAESGNPYVFDIGNGTTYRLTKELPEPPDMPEIPVEAYAADPPRGKPVEGRAEALAELPPVTSPYHQPDGKKSRNAPGDGGSAAPKTAAQLFAELKITEKETRDMEAIEFLIPDVVAKGHTTAYPSPPNGGKTALFTYLAGKMAEAGMEVFYIDVDSPPDALKRREAHARRHGYSVICPDMKVGKSVADAYRVIVALAASDIRLDDTVLIIDTLKKFVDMLSKGGAKAFYKMLRQLTARGATICLLSHTNKYKDAAGNLVFEGTADHRADVDNMVYLVSELDEKTGILEITTKPDKVRAMFKPRSFRVHTRDGLRVEECHGVLNLFDPDERIVLEELRQLLATGQMNQSELLRALMENTPYGRDNLRGMLFSLSSGEAAPVGRVKGPNNSLNFFLTPNA